MWNSTLISKQRVTEPRDRIWASDIGKHYWERYQKMMGVQPSEKLEDRVLREFAAGIWFEKMLVHVIKQIGIFKSTNERMEIPANDKHLLVSVKPDLIAGGQSNWDEARENVKNASFPEIVEGVCYKMIDNFESKFPEGLDEKMFEIKTVNSLVFWAKKEYLQEAYPHHTMQLYTGLKATGIKRGSIVYISKDDLTMAEFPVLLGTERHEEAWNKDVEEMSKFYRDGVEPPKPPDVVLDKRRSYKFQKDKEKYQCKGEWVQNWEVNWSRYFNLLTGQERDEWEKSVSAQRSEKNAKLKVEQFPNLFK